MRPRLAITLVILILLIVFLLQNSDIKTIEFLFFEQQMSLSVVISVSVLIGFILGLISPRFVRAKDKHYTLNQDLSDEK